MKILVCCRAIDNMAGGVERMASALMNDMTTRGHEMSLLSWDHKDAQSFYDINPAVRWEKLDIGDPTRKATWQERIARAIKTRKIIRDINPDVIIGFQDGPFMSVRLYTMGMRYPLVLAERNAPTRHAFTSHGKRKNIYFQIYRLARSITVQCKSYPNEYPAFLRDKITVIPNPVFPAPAPKNKTRTANNKTRTLLSVGRLSFQKNYMVLLRAFAQIAGTHPEWVLKIVGEGEHREKLQRFIDDNDLQNHIILAGTTTDVSAEYYAADAFCLPSLWEGFPNALAEAMAHGLPSAGFADCAGVRDLITHEETGILASGIDDADSLARALDTLLGDEKRQETFGQNAKKYVEQYAPKKVYDMWEKFFQAIVST